MSAPAIVQGDRIMGVCPNHPVPPGSPVPMPFSAPLTLGLVTTVLIGGKPAAVVGSSGYNLPPHAGIIDAFAAPNLQEGRILSGSVTVTIGGKPAATLQSTCMCCVVPGQLVPSVANVLIG
jgi:uncharacterized Zn-binding protein involved in type VI secretion